MKGKRFFLSALLALAVGASAYAETSFDFGIKGGVSVNMMPWTTLDLGDRAVANLGFFAGGFATMHLSDFLFLQADLMYARKGVTTRSEIQGDYSRNISYLQIPLYFGLDMGGNGRTHIMTGPGLGIYLGQNIYYTSPLVHPASYGNTPWPTYMFWALQGDYAITESLLVEVRADLGLTNTFKPDGIVADKGRNASISLGLCYRFGY